VSGALFRHNGRDIVAYPTWVYLVGLDAQIIEEQDSGGSGTVTTYTYGNYIDEVLTMDRAGNRYFHHQNTLWSVHALTDATGTVVERYAYDAYGMPSFFDSSLSPQPSSLVNNRLLFTGREWDAECSLYHYRARNYSPTLGRFLSRDPLGYVDGMNLYEYVRGNPTTRFDTSGYLSLSMADWQEILKEVNGDVVKAQQAVKKVLKFLSKFPLLKNKLCGGLIKFTSTDGYKCACGVASAVDIATGDAVTELVDCGCNFVTSLGNLCQYGWSSPKFAVQLVLTAIDCQSTAIGGFIGSLIGGGGGTATGGPAGGIGGGVVFAAIGGALTDAWAWALQNINNQESGSPFPVEAVSSCCKIASKKAKGEFLQGMVEKVCGPCPDE
jgi:RHS repeat-associated protein